MNCELGGAATWRHRLCDASDLDDLDATLDFLLVNVVDTDVGDCEHALLRPLKLIDLLNHCRIDQSV